MRLRADTLIALPEIMQLVLLIAAMAIVTVGVGVLWANSRRFANQVFTGLSLLALLWIFCVHRILHLGHQERLGFGAYPVAWVRANTAIVAFIPWCLWLLLRSIADDKPRRQETLQRSLGWLTLSVMLASLSFTPWFVFQAADGGRFVRGPAYFAYSAISVMAYATILLQACRELRKQLGIRRIELQFFVFNIGAGAAAITVMNGLGNWLRLPVLKDAAVLIIPASISVMAWAITVHRVFDARQILLSITQTLGVVVIFAGGAFGSYTLLREALTAPLTIIAGAAAAGFAALWFDRRSRHWLRITDEQMLSDMRAAIIAITRTEPDPERLIGMLEQSLCKQCQTQVASLLFDVGDRFASKGLGLSKNRPAYEALCEIGCATPEILERRRPTQLLSDLHGWLEENALAVVIASPRGSPAPSLVMALGPKKNRRPFTYPETQRLQNVAELIDNILTRSQLTTQAALKAKTEHLAMMSRGLAHDMKNLITPISSFLVHTERQIKPGTAEEEVHTTAKRSVRIMNEYIGEALFFSSRLTPKFEQVELATTLAAVCDLTLARARWRHVRVTFAGGTDTVVADRVLLERLLVNLVNNAIDASTAGATVKITARTDASSVFLQVSDEGCGIPPEHLDRIFDPYFTTKEFGDDVRGFGLGLTICQKIVALHGGRISVDSQVGRGTTVTVELPQNPSVKSVGNHP